MGAALPVYIDHAHGALLTDVDGNRFIDLGAGIGVTTIGHTNDAVVKAVQEQVAKLTHTLFTVTPYQPYVRVCELLNKHTPGNFEKRSALSVCEVQVGSLPPLVRVAVMPSPKS